MVAVPLLRGVHGSQKNVQASGYPLGEPIYMRRSLSIGFLYLLWSIVPSLLSAVTLYGVTWLYGYAFRDMYVVLMVVVLALCIIVMQSARSLVEQLTTSKMLIAADIAFRWLILLFLLLTIGYVTQLSEDYSRLILGTWAVATPVLIIAASSIFQHLLRRLMLNTANVRSTVFAGFNETSMSLAAKIQGNPQLCMSVAGFFDDRSTERLGSPSDIEIRGGLSDLAGYVQQHGIGVIFVALPIRHLKRVMDLLDDLRDTTASIYYVPDLFTFDLIQARTGDIMGVPVVAMCETPFHGYRGVSKRLFDVIVSLGALIVASPLLLMVAILVKLTSRGPVVFRQRRYGLEGYEITVYKFRTMNVTEDGAVIRQATKDDDRVTPIGHFLRKYSLDELPQLVNVLQGRMSLVGPRPHAIAHNEMYRKLIKGYMVRHKVLPGITGLAQVNGLRGETRTVEDMEARVHYDLEYLRRWSIVLDLKILARTAIMVFGDKRAY